MRIFYLELYWRLEWSLSLKDKRRELRSITTLLRKKFNISVMETGDRDKWQLVKIALCGLAPNDAQADQTINYIVAFCDAHCSGEVVIETRELM